MKQDVLALFDFDGTITSRDTLLDFVRYRAGNFRFCLGMILLLPAFIRYFCKRITNDQLKEAYLEFFFGGLSYVRFCGLCAEYAAQRLPLIIHQSALKTICQHQNAGHSVVIVSASFPEWITPWANTIGIKRVIGSRLHVQDGLISGRIAGKNCYGPEKVDRVKILFDLSRYHVYAYGDSRGDKEMLAWADESFYRVFS